MPHTNVAADIVAAIINDFIKRPGFNRMWFNTDAEDQKEIKDEWEDIIHQHLGTERPNIGCWPENKSPKIIRYFRPKSLTKVNNTAVMADHNLGGVCLVFEIYHDDGMLACGWKVFEENENFDKHTGAAIASAMLAKPNSTDTICIRYRKDMSLVDNLHHALWGAMSAQNDYLLNELNGHTRGNVTRLLTALRNADLNRAE